VVDFGVVACSVGICRKIDRLPSIVGAVPNLLYNIIRERIFENLSHSERNFQKSTVDKVYYMK